MVQNWQKTESMNTWVLLKSDGLKKFRTETKGYFRKLMINVRLEQRHVKSHQSKEEIIMKFDLGGNKHKPGN
jgi:hypothetical protein